MAVCRVRVRGENGSETFRCRSSKRVNSFCQLLPSFSCLTGPTEWEVYNNQIVDWIYYWHMTGSDRLTKHRSVNIRRIDRQLTTEMRVGCLCFYLILCLCIWYIFNRIYRLDPFGQVGSFNLFDGWNMLYILFIWSNGSIWSNGFI